MEEEIKSVWEDTCERFVAFLDIMGFREWVFSDIHDNIYKDLIKFQSAIKEIESQPNSYDSVTIERTQSTDLLTSLAKTQVKPVIFSDSIVLISNDSSAIALLKIFACVSWILQNALILKIPLKGAIAYGKMTADIDKSLYFGKPLIYAYELQEELLLYGIVLHHTTENRLSKIEVIKELKEDIITYLTPMKSGIINHSLVDSFTASLKSNVLKVISDYYQSVSGKHRIYVDNTLKFAYEIQARKTKPK